MCSCECVYMFKCASEGVSVCAFKPVKRIRGACNEEWRAVFFALYFNAMFPGPEKKGLDDGVDVNI